jgi:hypothetical protein
MTISAKLHWRGATGAHELSGGPSYTGVWQVNTTNPLEQAQTILQWFRANVMELGAAYTYAADTVGSTAKASRMRADRDLNSTGTWFVVVDFEPPKDEKGETESGEHSWDPIDWRPRISCSTLQYSKPVERAQFYGGYHGAALLAIPVGSFTVPMASNLVPFDPPLERDDSRLSIRIERNMAAFDADEAEEVVNAINLFGYRIDKYGFTASCPELTLRIREWSTNLRRQNNVDFWETSCTLERKRDTWIEDVVDRGRLKRALAGDPDGRGGSYSSGDIPAGAPAVGGMTGPDEEPITDALLLDGDGQPLNLAMQPLVPVYGRWLAYDRHILATVDFFGGILIPE